MLLKPFNSYLEELKNMNLEKFFKDDSLYKTQLLLGMVFSFISAGLFTNSIILMHSPNDRPDFTMFNWAYIVLCTYVSGQAYTGLKNNDGSLLNNWIVLKTVEGVYSAIGVYVQDAYRLTLLFILSSNMTVIAGVQIYIMIQNRKNLATNQNKDEKNLDVLISK